MKNAFLIVILIGSYLISFVEYINGEGYISTAVVPCIIWLILLIISLILIKLKTKTQTLYIIIVIICTISILLTIPNLIKSIRAENNADINKETINIIK